jgi:hypothetical protein
MIVPVAALTPTPYRHYAVRRARLRFLEAFLYGVCIWIAIVLLLGLGRDLGWDFTKNKK